MLEITNGVVFASRIQVEHVVRHGTRLRRAVLHADLFVQIYNAYIY